MVSCISPNLVDELVYTTIFEPYGEIDRIVIEPTKGLRMRLIPLLMVPPRLMLKMLSPPSLCITLLILLALVPCHIVLMMLIMLPMLILIPLLLLLPPLAMRLGDHCCR